MRHNLSYFALAALPMLSGCFSPAEEVAETSAATTLHVTTRAASGEISYPVQILAYDDNGELQGKQTLQSANDDIQLHLDGGLYHITALSGQGAYVEPKDYKKKSATLGIPAEGYARSPLMIGGADVLLGTTNASVSLVLSYRVASLSLSLKEVPADVTNVAIGISQQYGAIDMGGTLSGSASATVQCTRQAGIWQSPTVYVLPGVGTATTLTLSLTRAEGQVSYGYELGDVLQAAVPYKIEGTYVESTAPYITGMLTMEGWQPEQQLTFSFGNGLHNDGNTSTSVPTVRVDKIPAPGSVWNGHVVALVDNATATGADLLLLSLSEFDNVHSPNAEGYESEMQNIATSYGEDAISDWTVPSEAQARALRTAYAGDLDGINAVIESQDGVALAVYTTNGNARFLCERGTKTFNWAKNGSITTAGTSVKYRLRLVKTIHAEVH